MARMKKLSLALVAALSLAAPHLAQAKAGRVGLGIILGEPSGLSGKVWLDDINAVDFAIGSFGYYVGSPYGGLNLHADYLWHHYGVFGDPGSAAYHHMPLYLGLGAVYSQPGLAGVRGVLGITYLFEKPFDLFFEVAPTLVIAPYAGFGTDVGLGGRFYF